MKVKRAESRDSEISESEVVDSKGVDSKGANCENSESKSVDFGADSEVLDSEVAHSKVDSGILDSENVARVRIYIINLARSPERKAKMRELIAQLAELDSVASKNFTFEFFDAVDYKDSARFYEFERFYNARIVKFVRGKELTLGERACWASHYSLWCKCVELKEPIIVLEDDILFLENFCAQILKIYTAFLSGACAEYVRLYSIKKIKKSKPSALDSVICTNESCAGTQGYFLAPRAAQKFINHAQKWNYPVDDYMDAFFIHGVQILCCAPFVIAEQDVPTNITDRAQKISALNKLTREICRIYMSLRKAVYVIFH